MCSFYRSTNVLSSKYNSTFNHYCPNNWQQKWVHPKWTCQNCQKCLYFVRAPLLSSTDLIFLGMGFIRAAHPAHCWHLLPLLHSDITELLDVRHIVLLHLPLEDAPHELNRVQVWRHTWPLHHLHLQQQGSCHLGGVFGVVMLENSFLKGGHHLLLQNVTGHVGIHVSLNEPQLPSTSSSHAAPDHDATTTMLNCSQGTIFLVLLTRASPHMLDTIWVKQFYLRPGVSNSNYLGAAGGRVWVRLGRIKYSTKKGFHVFQKKEHNLSNLLNLYYNSSSTWMFLLNMNGSSERRRKLSRDFPW